jgi:histidine triad (HIT) family protein
MTDSCLFCKMVSGEVKPDIVYEDDYVMAFRDIKPQAPVHILVIPKRHIATLNDLRPEDMELAGRLMLTAQHVARAAGIAETGFRALVNCNQDGGQVIYHMHLHVLGGHRLRSFG